MTNNNNNGTEKLLEKLSEISDRQAEMNATLAVQASQLAEHMRRTELLEEQIKPIEAHVIQLRGIMKFIGGISVLAGIGASIVKMMAGG